MAGEIAIVDEKQVVINMAEGPPVSPHSSHPIFQAPALVVPLVPTEAKVEVAPASENPDEDQPLNTTERLELQNYKNKYQNMQLSDIKSNVEICREYACPANRRLIDTVVMNSQKEPDPWLSRPAQGCCCCCGGKS